MLNEMTMERFGKPVAGCTDEELYLAALALCKQRMADVPYIEGERRLYYLSAEFLVGKLLTNSLLSLGLYGEVQAELRAAGRSMAALEDAEPEPAPAPRRGNDPKTARRRALAVHALRVLRRRKAGSR